MTTTSPPPGDARAIAAAIAGGCASTEALG
jgi:hypothetical protein